MRREVHGFAMDGREGNIIWKHAEGEDGGWCAEEEEWKDNVRSVQVFVVIRCGMYSLCVILPQKAEKHLCFHKTSV